MSGGINESSTEHNIGRKQCQTVTSFVSKGEIGLDGALVQVSNKEENQHLHEKCQKLLEMVLLVSPATSLGTRNVLDVTQSPTAALLVRSKTGSDTRRCVSQ